MSYIDHVALAHSYTLQKAAVHLQRGAFQLRQVLKLWLWKQTSETRFGSLCFCFICCLCFVTSSIYIYMWLLLFTWMSKTLLNNWVVICRNYACMTAQL